MARKDHLHPIRFLHDRSIPEEYTDMEISGGQIGWVKNNFGWNLFTTEMVFHINFRWLT